MSNKNVLIIAVAVGAFSILFAIVQRGEAGNGDGRGGGPAGLPDLVSGLKGVKGCLGVETARTSSGKNVIFAWFEDKAAAKRWYYSDMHQDAMKKFFPGGGARPPMTDIPDDSGPIMAIASITMAQESKHKETTLPVSQIAIELYKPINGGIFLGGRFAPDSMKVDKIRDYTPKSP